MKVYDVEIESKEALKEAFLHKEPIKIGYILYMSECHSYTRSWEVDVCELCRFYRIKGMLKSHIADKVCSACAHADLDVNFNADRWNLSLKEPPTAKLHYLLKHKHVDLLSNETL